MALIVNTRRDGEPMYRVDRRVYLTRDGKLVDYERREQAVELYKAQGGPVSKAELEHFGEQLERFIPELATKEEPKAAEKPETKKRGPSRNKKATPKADK